MYSALIVLVFLVLLALGVVLVVVLGRQRNE